MARATVISVRAKVATIIAGTEMETEADLAREDHRAAMAARVDSAETEIMMSGKTCKTGRFPEQRTAPG